MPSSPVTKGSLFSLQIWPTWAAPAAMVLSVGDVEGVDLAHGGLDDGLSISLELETA